MTGLYHLADRDLAEELIAEKHDLLNRIEHEHNPVRKAQYVERLKEIEAAILRLRGQ